MRKKKTNLMIATVTGGAAPPVDQVDQTTGKKSIHQIENVQVLTTDEMKNINNAGERIMRIKW